MEESEMDEQLVARDLPEFLHVMEEMKEKVGGDGGVCLSPDDLFSRCQW